MEIRRQVEFRPAVVICFGLILGLVSPTHPELFLVLIGLFLLVRPPATKALGLVFFVVGILLAPTPTRSNRNENYFLNSEVTVVSVPIQNTEGETCILRHKDELIKALTTGDLKFNAGEIWRVKCVVKPRDNDGQRYSEFIGTTTIEPFQATKISSGSAIFRFATHQRRSFEVFLDKTATAGQAGFLKALTIRSLTTSEDTSEALRRTGTIHVVSASGVDVMALAWIMNLILSRLPIPRIAQISILMIVLSVYAIDVGLPSPTIRAVVMTGLYLVAYLFRREPDSLSALAIAAAGYLLFDPSEVHSMGFQLSMVVVAGILLFPPIRFAIKNLVLREIYRYVHVSAVASLFAAPILAYHTGWISMNSIPANVLVVWSACLSVVLCFLGFLISPLLAGAAKGMIIVASGCAAYIDLVIKWLDRIIPDLGVMEFTPYWLLILYAAILLVWRERLVQPDVD